MTFVQQASTLKEIADLKAKLEENENILRITYKEVKDLKMDHQLVLYLKTALLQASKLRAEDQANETANDTKRWLSGEPEPEPTGHTYPFPLSHVDKCHICDEGRVDTMYMHLPAHVKCVIEFHKELEAALDIREPQKL